MSHQTLFLQQSYIDCTNQYTTLLEEPNIPLWDYVVLTASNEEQALNAVAASGANLIMQKDSPLSSHRPDIETFYPPAVSFRFMLKLEPATIILTNTLLQKRPVRSDCHRIFPCVACPLLV